MVTPGALAVFPQPLQGLHGCRVSRETRAPVFTVNFGSGKAKPRILRPLTVQGARVEAEWPTLQALSGKESGTVYYSEKGLQESASAVRLLTAAASLQEAYSRLPLLFTPSQPKSLPPNLKVVLVEDIFHSGVATTDGASDVGWRSAVELGLLTSRPQQGFALYAAEQFRAFLALDSTHHLVAKGMLMVDPRRQEHLHVRRSCQKMAMCYACAASSDHLGLDISGSTAQPPPAGRINSQLTAALAMRAMSAATEESREALLGRLTAMPPCSMRSCRK